MPVPSDLPRAEIRPDELPAKIERLTSQLEAVRMMVDPVSFEGAEPVFNVMKKVDATFDEVYGVGTVEAMDAHGAGRKLFDNMQWAMVRHDYPKASRAFFAGREKLIDHIEDHINRLQAMLGG